jgi:hypothetical protein
MATPSERTVKLLRSLGWTVGRVEMDMRRPDPENPGKMMYWKRDLWNVADYISFGHGRVLLVQTTNSGNFAGHITKINENPITKQWVENGQEICIIAWRPEAKTQPRLAAWDRYRSGDEVPSLPWLNDQKAIVEAN